MLKSEGRDLEEYKNIIRDQILASRIIHMHVGKNVVPTKSQIKAYYTKHHKEFWEPPKVRLRHILFIVDNDASDESEAAKESDDPGTEDVKVDEPSSPEETAEGENEDDSPKAEDASEE